MAEDLEEILRQQEKITERVRQQLGLSREQTAEQAEQLLQYRSITDEIIESISKIRKRTEAEKALLGLGRKLQESAKENHSYLAEIGKLDAAILKTRKQQLLTEVELEAQKQLVARGGRRDLQIAEELFSLQKRIELLDLDNIKKRETMVNLSREAQREVLAEIQNQERLKDRLAEQLALRQDYLGSSKQEIKLLKEKRQEIIDQSKKIRQLEIRMDREPDSFQKHLIGGELEEQRKILKEINKEYLEIYSQQPRIGEETEKQIKHLVALMGMQHGFQTVLDSQEETLQVQERINQVMGLTGVGVKVLGGLFKTIGVNSSVVSQNLSEAEKAMREAAKSGSNWKTLLVGVNKLSQGISKHLRDPLVILTGLVHVTSKLNSNVTHFQRTVGMSRKGARQLNLEIENQARNLNDVFINSDRLRKSFAEMTGELGFNILPLGGEVLNTYSHLTENLGMSSQHASNLAIFMRMNGKNTELQMKSMDRVVQSFAKQNKFGVNLKKVYADLGTLSKAVLLNIGRSPQKAAELVMTLQKAKLEMGDLEGIMSNLVNFEASIQNEMEARLLTGDGLNLARSRELALMNDYQGVAEEITRQEAVRRAFINKNRIAQESVAKAIGVSVEKLGEMYYQQELLRLGEPGFKNMYGDLTYQSTKALDTTQKFKAMVDKLKLSFQALLLPLEPLINLVGHLAEGLTKVLTTPLGRYLASGAAGLWIFGKALKGALGWFPSLLGKLKGGFLGNLFGKRLQDSLGGLGEGLKQVAGEASREGAKNLTTASKGFSSMIIGSRGIKLLERVDGKRLKKVLEGIAEGLQEMSEDEVKEGSKNLLRSSLSFIAMIPGYLGVKLLEKVNGPVLNRSLSGIAKGLQKMALPGVKSGIGSLFLLGPAGALSTLSLPFLLGITLLGSKVEVGLSGLARGLAALGNPATLKYAAAGSLLLLSLGASALAVGYGLKAAATGIKAIGSVIKDSFSGIAEVIEKLYSGVRGLITGVGESIAATVPAIEAFGNVFQKIFTGLSGIIKAPAQGLETMISTIKTVTVKDISTVLTLSKAIRTLTQSIKELNQVGPVSISISEIRTPRKEESQEEIQKKTSTTRNTYLTPEQEPEYKQLLQKLDELIGILKTRGGVYLDGNKVGEVLRLGTFRQG